MARQAWERTITDNAGNVLTGVQVTVFLENGSTLATIYSQQNGGAALANPFNTGAQTSAKFYADPGRYVVRVFKDGNTKEFTDVDIAGKAVRDDIGTAAYLTATTGLRDATPGRALRVRDFGVGFDAINITPAELNQLNANGFYSVVASADAPTMDPYEIQHIQFDINSAKQVAYEAGSIQTRMYVRVKGGSTWFPWRKIYNSSDVIGPVAFSGGLNTGAVIERGSNANGEFVKFADGTMICTHAVRTVHAPPVFVFFYTWTYPAAFVDFVDGPAVSGSFWCIEQGVAFRRGVFTRGNVEPAAGSPVAYVAGADLNSQNFNESRLQLTAIGRWR